MNMAEPLDTCDLLCLDLLHAEEIRAAVPDGATVQVAAAAARGLGDGTRLSCGKGTRWRPSMVDRDGMVGESPTCGHVYQQQGRYAVRASAHWVAEWRGYGESGTIRLDVNSTRQLRVGEIQVIVTRGR